LGSIDIKQNQSYAQVASKNLMRLLGTWLLQTIYLQGSLRILNFEFAVLFLVLCYITWWSSLNKSIIFLFPVKTCMHSFPRFSLPKHSVLKYIPKLPIIQLKFRMKSTKHSSQSQYPRSFVFGKIYKFNTKLRDFNRNVSGIGQWVTIRIGSTYFRSNQLAAWSAGLRCWLWAQKFSRNS
jgi:hypothetical protein